MNALAGHTLLSDPDAAVGWHAGALGLAALLDAMLDAVWLVDVHSLSVVGANATGERLLRATPGGLTGRPVVELAATPEDLYFWQEVAAGNVDQIESETLVRRFDGEVVPVLRRVRRLTGSDGRGLYAVVLHDRSAQRRVEMELEDRLAELAATLESTADGILTTDLAGNIRSFNRRFAELWGLPRELMGERNDDAVLTWMRRSVADPSAYMRRLASLDDATMMQAVDTIRLHSGRVLERVAMPQLARGVPIGRVFSFRDLTERLQQSERIDALSRTDSLTGLPNRTVLADRVEFALALARREGTPFALLFVNLDRFKHINDTLGHAFGDRVLCDVSERLRSCLRQLDTVARVGGDEFIVLVHQADVRAAEITARRMLQAMQAPFEQGGLSFTLTCSIGAAVHPADGDSLDDLVRCASAAMQQVKDSGRNNMRFLRKRDEAGQADPRSRMRLDHAMRQGLVEGRFRLHYQPQVDIDSGRVHGAEALLRWRDPDLGEVSPAEFIPVAEETGFIVTLGGWVLREAVRQAAVWRGRGLDMVVSINVSALQFEQPDFVDSVARVVSESGLEPRALELELTESILIQDAHEALQKLIALSQLGVRLAIDDFGTGYSSLGYLKRFPIGRLKIDRSFVKGLPADESDAGIVHAIVHLGRALGLTVIAEGVETEAQRAFLREAGCTEFQGFLCAPALPAEDFEARVSTGG